MYLFRHSNGSADDHHDDGDDQPDDAGSLSRSDSEDNVAQIQNGHNNNNNGYTHKSTFNVYKYLYIYITLTNITLYSTIHYRSIFRF